MSEREWRFYLIDMLNFSENILTLPIALINIRLP
jgi:uncharacterized protein with HEPN domain